MVRQECHLRLADAARGTASWECESAGCKDYRQKYGSIRSFVRLTRSHGGRGKEGGSRSLRKPKFGDTHPSELLPASVQRLLADPRRVRIISATDVPVAAAAKSHAIRVLREVLLPQPKNPPVPVMPR